MWRVVMRSNRPEAAAFQDWLADEVLPSIRKTGEYRTATRTRVLQLKIAKLRDDIADQMTKINIAVETPSERRDAYQLLSNLERSFLEELAGIVGQDAWPEVLSEMRSRKTYARAGTPAHVRKYKPLPGYDAPTEV